MKAEDNIEVVVAKIKRFQRNSTKGMEEVARIWAYKLRDEIRRLAPVETGHYRSTINVREVELKSIRSGFEIDVFTEHPAARRLEMGFTGVDALGRHYDQAPRPHWRPAEDAIIPQYKQAVEKEIPRWWK